MTSVLMFFLSIWNIFKWKERVIQVSLNDTGHVCAKTKAHCSYEREKRFSLLFVKIVLLQLSVEPRSTDQTPTKELPNVPLKASPSTAHGLTFLPI